jgi:hypothetical protein
MLREHLRNLVVVSREDEYPLYIANSQDEVVGRCERGIFYGRRCAFMALQTLPTDPDIGGRWTIITQARDLRERDLLQRYLP